MYEEPKVSPASPSPKSRQDFTIPNLFDVKGKIGAYAHSPRKSALNVEKKAFGSRGHRWWVRNWHDDCHRIRAERRQGLRRVSQGEAAQGGEGGRIHAHVRHHAPFR